SRPGLDVQVVRLPPVPQPSVCLRGTAHAEPFEHRPLFDGTEVHARPTDLRQKRPHLRWNGNADRLEPVLRVVVRQVLTQPGLRGVQLVRELLDVILNAHLKITAPRPLFFLDISSSCLAPYARTAQTAASILRGESLLALLMAMPELFGLRCAFRMRWRRTADPLCLTSPSRTASANRSQSRVKVFWLPRISKATGCFGVALIFSFLPNFTPHWSIYASNSRTSARMARTS